MREESNSALNFTLDRSRIAMILGVVIHAKMSSRKTCKFTLFLGQGSRGLTKIDGQSEAR